MQQVPFFFNLNFLHLFECKKLQGETRVNYSANTVLKCEKIRPKAKVKNFIK